MTETAVAAEEQNQTEVQSVEFSEVREMPADGPGASMDILLDLEVPVTVLIGRAKVPIEQFLKLNPGSVLKLDQSVDTPVELYLKDTMFATGDIVVVEDRFAVRIKQIYGDQRPENKRGK